MRHRHAAVFVTAALLVAACSTGSDSTGSSSPAEASTPNGGATVDTDSTTGTTDTTGTTGTTGVTDSVDASVPGDVVAIVTDGQGLADGWDDFGWAAKITDTSVELNLREWGGWITSNSELDGSFSELRIQLRSDSTLNDDFLRVQLSDSIGSSFPVITPEFERSDDTLSTTVGMGELLSGMGGFERILLSANQEFSDDTIVVVAELSLVRGTPEPTTIAGSETAGASIDCIAQPEPISEHIYGTARPLESDTAQFEAVPASRRWGGNPTSRYNWRNGAWHTAFDYYWQNVDVSGGQLAHERFLEENWINGADSAFTIPLLGWVAKDTSSVSFPVSVFGNQEDADPFNEQAGNGRSPDGDELDPLDPTTTSDPSTPADIAAWITSMNEFADASGQASPFMYILGNEPMLWNSTHRDVFPEPLGYDELLKRSIEYSEAIRTADPDALIAGPAVWGWPAYFYSAVDAESGFDIAVDRREHGNDGLIEWYLAEMAAYEERTGERLLDVLDVHFYPQNGSYSSDISERAATGRLRATRALWDRNYQDESWIEDSVELIPRMQDWVDDNYPGTLLSIGEYSFGAEGHISGGLAQAEALGRFGQNGLFAAYYWITPPKDTPVYWAFRAYRDYDGNGSRFGELSRPTDADRPLSLFASTTASGDTDVVIALNLVDDQVLETDIAVDGCGYSNVTTLQYTGRQSGFEPADAALAGDRLSVELPPYSITIFELS